MSEGKELVIGVVKIINTLPQIIDAVVVVGGN